MSKKQSRDALIKSVVGKVVTSKAAIKEANAVPEPTHSMLGGGIGYMLDDKLHLLTVLNTYNFTDSFYKSSPEFISTLRNLIEKIAMEDPEFVVKAIVYSRCCGSGLRTITQLASVILLPIIRNTPLAKKLFSKWDKKNGKGGMIYRPDDMKAIQDLWKMLGNNIVLPNSMKKGFREVIESLDSYSLLKYKKSIIDISNLVHPNPNKSKATVEVDGETIPTISAIMLGKNVSADTWETGLSDVGQVVANLEAEGEAKEEALRVGKREVFLQLLQEDKMGYLAMIRNISNILKNASDSNDEIISSLCSRIREGERIKSAKIMPHQLINAYLHAEDKRVVEALDTAIDIAMVNFSEVITGKVAILLDVSGSIYKIEKEAAAITSILYNALADRSTLFTFAERGEKSNIVPLKFSATYDSILNGFTGGGTNLADGLRVIKNDPIKYDRIIIISDNEANRGYCVTMYKEYIKTKNSPKIYSVDLAGYGETSLPIEGKVRLYYGKTFAMFDDMIMDEFNPMSHVDRVNQLEL